MAKKRVALNAAPKNKSNLRLNEEWAKLLSENETRSKPLTDEQLVERMTELFPEKKGKTTLTRISTVRACYNSGVNLFAKFGQPKRKSKRYFGDGTSKTPCKKKSTNAKPAAAAKPAAEKKAATPLKKKKKKAIVPR